jgi:hypothetical protein
LGDSVKFQYNGGASAERKRWPWNIDSDSNIDLLCSEDDAPLSESKDDSNDDVYIVPSRKARRTVSPMGV